MILVTFSTQKAHFHCFKDDEDDKILSINDKNCHHSVFNMYFKRGKIFKLNFFIIF